jgi:hypothetical protein
MPATRKRKPDAKRDAKGDTHAFVAKIVRFTVLYCVDVPAAISRELGRARVPVVARVERGSPYRATLVPAGGGRHRLFVNGEIRAEAGVEIGQRVRIEVRVDREPREVPIPPDLTEALRDEGVLGAWESMPPGQREHILKWIDQAVHEATRAKRIARAVEEALRRHEKKLDCGAT